MPRGRGDDAVALCPRLWLRTRALPGRRGDGDRDRSVGRLIRVEKSVRSGSHRVSRTHRLGSRSRCRTGTPTRGIRHGAGHVGLQCAVSADSAGAIPAGCPRACRTICRRRASRGGQCGGAGQRLKVVKISSLSSSQTTGIELPARCGYQWRNCRYRSTLVPVNRQHGDAVAGALELPWWRSVRAMACFAVDPTLNGGATDAIPEGGRPVPRHDGVHTMTVARS